MGLEYQYGSSLVGPTLNVQKLYPWAKLPTVANVGEDLGYDVYALNPTTLLGGGTYRIHTGIAVQAKNWQGNNYGLIVKDRSSLAVNGLYTHGGVIDAGYTGEIIVLMSYSTLGFGGSSMYHIKAGDKIAQLVPVPVLTGEIKEVESLEASLRSDRGFGSSGN